MLIDLAVATTRGGGNNGNGDPLLLITFPGAYDNILAFMLGLGGLFGVIYGAAIAGSEWTWGTFKTSVARGGAAAATSCSTFAAIAVVLAVGLLITFLIGVVAAAISATIAGESASTGSVTPTRSRGCPSSSHGAGWPSPRPRALGFAVATLARSQLAGIGVGIAFYFGETFAGIFLPDVVKYLPFHLANAAVASGEGELGRQGAAPALPADTALVLVTVWLIGALVVAALFSERAEITG